ncbi:amidohydrolase family protein [candidate division GN15 bacterium]|nr:amidohydrolase family protein [candidate division GN15 bacterium]
MTAKTTGTRSRNKLRKPRKLKARTLLYNGRIYTMAAGLIADSMAMYGSLITDIGSGLQHESDFKSYSRIDLNGMTVVPGLVDAHTHFGYWAVLLGQLDLDGVRSLDRCLQLIRQFSAKLSKRDWVVGVSYSPDRFDVRREGDRLMLDKVTGGRPACIFNKDLHSAWVNTAALEIAGIDGKTNAPGEGVVELFPDGTPSGVLKEMEAYEMVSDCIPAPSRRQLDASYQQALQIAYSRGVTGVHSFDGPAQFAYFSDLAEKNKLGLRINYYPKVEYLPDLERAKTRYGTGNDFLRVAGIKIFADGALGSQTAYCFNKYLGSKDNYGIETKTTAQMVRLINRAGRLGFPCAIHAIGDRAIANVLDAFELARPPKYGRHRIEHLQLVRRKDLARVKRLGVIASMQPSHCPSDIGLVRRYWGKRSRNTYVLRSVLDKGIDLALGSDAPIEPLDPIAGIAAAVRRAKPGSRDVFHPEQRITAYEALYGFTAGAAVASGQESTRGYLLPGYPADFVILSQDLTRVAPMRIDETEVIATVLDGTVRYQTRSIL